MTSTQEAAVSLRIKKKITAVMPDGSSKQNLGIQSATTLVAGQPQVQVLLDPNEATARPLMDELAKTLNYEIKHGAEANVYVLEAAAIGGVPVGAGLPATEAPQSPVDVGVQVRATTEQMVNESPTHEQNAAIFLTGQVTPLPIELTETPAQIAAKIGAEVPAAPQGDQGPYTMTPAIAESVKAVADVVTAANTGTEDLGGSTQIKATRSDEDLERLYPPSSPLMRNGTIVLGAQEVFLDCEKAYAHLLGQLKALGTQPLPGRYHAELTQTFFKGSVEGQVHSVFKDLKRFGLQGKVIEKIVNLMQYALQAADPAYRTYIYFIRKGFLPHHTVTFANGRVRSSFFKFWFMYELIRREGLSTFSFVD